MKRVAVFCGSRPGANRGFSDAAVAMGRALARRGIGLVYGGGRLGLMGVIADAVLEAGGEVIGVIPEALEEKEQAHRGVTELLVVPNMHQRKRAMSERADGFIAMPGGLGTLEETFEVWTWAQLGLHENPVGLLDVDGFYQPLVSMLSSMAQQEFVQLAHVEMVHVSSDPERLLDVMERHVPPPVRHWIQGSDT